jgi:Restriction endonuclease EcoRV
MTLNQKLFKDDFFNLTNNWDWEVEGFVDKKGFIYPIDTDTKVISTVFERLSSPAIRSVAKKYSYVVETANQTTYPDFTLSKYDGEKLIHRVAIDIKTTYASKSMLFTLGGYNSFLRTETKNILYPYSTYAEHWILGFIYKQNTAFKEYDLESMPKTGDIGCPYEDVFIFLREKYEITGIRAGSGNTKNIGSIKLTSPSDFSTSMGPFCKFSNGKEACDFYWKNYEKYVLEIKNEVELLSHSDFLRFK